ncbi:hypothetical protein ACGFNU_10155 [Spirillospora sp. NPDC048911]|uniref:hypothetical protein n=1 Tax=Spirillospora sp. NPDC048911 TaxID=3364527 RepID=UPI00371A97F0
MTVSAGSNNEWTRPDTPLPRKPGTPPAPGGEPDAGANAASGAAPGAAPGAGPAAAEPAAGPNPTPALPMPLPSPAEEVRPTIPSGSSGQNWHRFHYPVGAFLVAYGITGLAGAALGWAERRDEVAGYLGAGAATPVLATVKVIEALLLIIAAAGLLRRRDVWFLPAITGWIVGFGVFCVLDVVKGKWTGLVEHGAYLLLFAVLLVLTYGLSVKARVGDRPQPADAAAVPPPPGGPMGSVPAPREGGLTRTQELALAAINRWQRGAQPQAAPPPAASPPPPGAPQPPAPNAPQPPPPSAPQ